MTNETHPYADIFAQVDPSKQELVSIQLGRLIGPDQGVSAAAHEARMEELADQYFAWRQSQQPQTSDWLEPARKQMSEQHAEEETALNAGDFPRPQTAGVKASGSVLAGRIGPEPDERGIHISANA